MGADIYFPSYRSRERKVLKTLGVSKVNLWKSSKSILHRYWKMMEEAEKEGYFRDSYNSSNTLWRYGLSWWKDVGALVDKKGNLSGENLKKFLKLLEDAEFNPLTYEVASQDRTTWGYITKKEVEEWNTHWQEQHKRLVEMVKLAIRKRGSVHCSI